MVCCTGDNRSMEVAELVKMAKTFRKRINQPCGVVLFWDGEPYAWKDIIRDPQSERPGVLAVHENNIYQAVGGNDYDGAKSWKLITSSA